MAQTAKANRKTRRATASKSRKSPSKDASSNGVPKLSTQQKAMLEKVNGEIIKIERRVAALALEQSATIDALRQKRVELQTLCENALRAHGVDFESPDSGRWTINVDTMEVIHLPASPKPDTSSA